MLWKMGLLFEQQRIKLWSKWHVINITYIMQHVLKCSKFPCYLNISNDLLGVLKRLTYIGGFTIIMCFLIVKLYHSWKSTADQSIAYAWTIISFFSVPQLLFIYFWWALRSKRRMPCVETCPFIYLYRSIIDRTVYLIFMKFRMGLFFTKSCWTCMGCV